MGLVLGSPTLEPAATRVELAPGVARGRLGAGDLLGERMFGRALHRRRILLAEQKRLSFCVQLGVRELVISRSYDAAVIPGSPPCH